MSQSENIIIYGPDLSIRTDAAIAGKQTACPIYAIQKRAFSRVYLVPFMAVIVQWVSEPQKVTGSEEFGCNSRPV
jgi:hypothetical protein